MKLEQQLRELEKSIEALELSDDIKKALLLIKKEVHEAYADVAREMVEDCEVQSRLAERRAKFKSSFQEYYQIDAQWYQKMANMIRVTFLDVPPTVTEFVHCKLCGGDYPYGQQCHRCANT